MSIAVYLAGAMDYVGDYAKGWRKSATEALEFLGYKVYDPTSIPEDPNMSPDEIAQKNLRAVIAKLVERGWHIEMQNDFDAILSKKQGFNWILHLILLLIFAVIFPPLALFWLFVMVILAVTRKPSTKRVWVEKNGETFEK